MKSFIVLAIAVHLVTVQGSRIIQQDLDYEQYDDYGRDYISADRSDVITAWEDLDEIQGMRMIEDAHPEKKSNPVKCQDSTCRLCYHSFCLGVTHLSGKNQLYLHVGYNEHNLFDKTVDVKDIDVCKTVKFFRIGVKSCLQLTDTKIVDGKVCTTVKARGGTRRINNKAISEHCRGKFTR